MSDRDKSIMDQEVETHTSSQSSGLDESLSALMDDEASPFELRRIVAAAATDNPDSAHIRRTWSRYHLIRSSLSQEQHAAAGVDLLTGIHQRLAEEGDAIEGAGPMRHVAGFARRFGQATVAASVAFAVLFTASYIHDAGDNAAQGGSAQQIAGQDPDAMPETLGDFSPSRLSRTVSMDAEARDRIQQAVLQFSETRQGPLGEAYTFPEVDAADPLDSTDSPTR